MLSHPHQTLVEPVLVSKSLLMVRKLVRKLTQSLMSSNQTLPAVGLSSVLVVALPFSNILTHILYLKFE